MSLDPVPSTCHGETGMGAVVVTGGSGGMGGSGGDGVLGEVTESMCLPVSPGGAGPGSCRLLTPPLPLCSNVHSAHCAHSGSQVQGRSLEGVPCW